MICSPLIKKLGLRHRYVLHRNLYSRQQIDDILSRDDIEDILSEQAITDESIADAIVNKNLLKHKREVRNVRSTHLVLS